MAKDKKKEKETTDEFSGFDQMSKDEALQQPENWTMSHVCDPTNFEPSVKDEPRVLEGTLFACDPLNCKVSLITDGKAEGPQFDMTEGVECELNGVPTEPEDLKRGDKVVLTGDPVVKIVASR